MPELRGVSESQEPRGRGRPYHQPGEGGVWEALTIKSKTLPNGQNFRGFEARDRRDGSTQKDVNEGMRVQLMPSDPSKLIL